MTNNANNNIYDSNFYNKTLRPDRQYSYAVIAKYIKTELYPNIKSAIEFGCGAGWFLHYLKEYGVTNLTGIESSEDAFKIMNNAIKPLVKKRSLNRLINLKKKYDVALCVEVAEHIDEKYSDTLIKSITNHSDTIVFSAATPRQGGNNHVNEQPIEYWIEKFSSNEFEYQSLKTAVFRGWLRLKKSKKEGHQVKKWYVNNIAVFEHK